MSAVARGLVASAYRDNGNKCRLTIAKQPVNSFVPIVKLFHKNSPYTKAFSEQYKKNSIYYTQIYHFIIDVHLSSFYSFRIQELLEAGVIDYYFSKYLVTI